MTGRRQDARTPLVAAFLRHRERLRRFIARLAIRPEDVDDILQETFLSAYGVENPSAIESPRFYLFTVARRAAYRELKRQSARMTQSIEEAVENGAELAADEAAPDDAVYARAHFATLSEVVSELSPQCRRVFILRKVLGYSHNEISAALGISKSTVEKHLARAMMRCLQDHRLRAFNNVKESAGDGAANTVNE